MYPPGIPVLARGEVIQDSHLQVLARLHRSLAISTPNSSAKTNNAVAAGAGGGGFPSGTTVTGCTNATLGTILVYL